MMQVITEILLAASIGIAAPPASLGAPKKEVVHLTQEMLIGITDDLIKADIAEVDIDPAVFDITPEPKKRKKTALDDIEFITEAEKPI